MPWPYAIVACSIGFHVFAGRRRPATSPGKPVFGGVPNPASASICHIVSGGSDSAIFAAPTFDDFWITCSTVSAPFGCASWIVLGPIVSVPGAVWMIVSGRTLPTSSAAAIVNGFIVEPGSNTSVSARLRIFSRATRLRAFGLYVGQLASARISPLSTSRITRPPAFALLASTAAFSSRNARYCSRESIASARSRPACGARIASTSSTASPRRLMITRRLPGLPPSQSCCASSMPSWPASWSPVKPRTWLIVSPPG